MNNHPKSSDIQGIMILLKIIIVIVIKGDADDGDEGDNDNNDVRLVPNSKKKKNLVKDRDTSFQGIINIEILLISLHGHEWLVLFSPPPPSVCVV